MSTPGTLETISQVISSKYPMLLFTIVVFFFGSVAVIQMNSFDRRVSHVENVEIPAIRDELKQMRDELTQMNQRLTKLEVKVDYLIEDMKEVKADLKEIKADISEIKTLLARQKNP